MSKRDLFEEFDIDEDTLFQDPSLFLDDENEMANSNSQDHPNNRIANTSQSQPGLSGDNNKRGSSYSKSITPPFKSIKHFHNFSQNNTNAQR
jgi:hypothetical protein